MSQFPARGETPPPEKFAARPYAQEPDGRLVYPSFAFARPTGWFLVNWVFFWPSAIYSLVAHWEKIAPAAGAGDVAGAQLHAAKVKELGIIALCIGLVVIAVVAAQVLSAAPVAVHAFAAVPVLFERA